MPSQENNNDAPFGKVPEISVGVSDAILLVVSAIGFVMLAVTIYSIVLTRLKSAHEIEQEERELNYDERLANADVATLNRAQRRARARHIMKQQRRIVAPAVGGGDNDNDGEHNQEDDQPQNNNEPQEALLALPMDPSQRHLSRKERQKAAKVAEKEERSLFEEERRRQQQEAQDVAKREKKQKERLLSERAEEDRRVRQHQREEEEMATYHEWKTFLASKDRTTILSVKDWIQELEKKSRIVVVKDLAERFQASAEEVVSRIQTLLSSSRISGVLESDGRFIYISQEEMRTVASFIKAQEKISMQAIAKKTEELIGFN
jgi:type IV secretory pathway VirB10-like protein